MVRKISQDKDKDDFPHKIYNNLNQSYTIISRPKATNPTGAGNVGCCNGMKNLKRKGGRNLPHKQKTNLTS